MVPAKAAKQCLNSLCLPAEIFYQASCDPFHTYSVSMSYIQIYMELIQDLLNPVSDNLVRSGQRPWVCC